MAAIPTLTTAPRGNGHPIAAPVVEFIGLGRTFPSTPPVHALSGVDLVVERGAYVAIAGPSGSGKSTLLNIVGLLDRPTAGTYLLDGIDTAVLTDAQRAALRSERIGFVFQSFHLLSHRSAMENVMLGSLYRGISRARRRTSAVGALTQVGLGHRASFLPTRLSGGERQRVAVARAIAAQPSLLLCDEPTGNLDSVNTVAILDLFDELRADGLTIVIITHDDEVARRAQRRVRIVDGVLHEIA
jgi:putative ABC transport system ATP-binding protein